MLAMLGSMEPARAAPPDAEVLALTRALAYDRRLASRAGSAIRIAIVDNPDDAGSVTRASAVRAVLEGMAPLTIQKRPVEITTLDDDASEIDVIYLCIDHLPERLTQASEQDWVILGFGRTVVEEGAHLGIVESQSGPRLLVNLPASRAAGIEFSSRLLQVSEIHR